MEWIWFFRTDHIRWDSTDITIAQSIIVALIRSFEMYDLEFFLDQNEEWRWRVIARNGNIVADSSEGYKNKQDCELVASRILDLNTVAWPKT